MKWKKPVIILRILKKDVRDIMARFGRPKTLNNGSTNPHETFGYFPQSLKTHLQKKDETGLKTQKRI